MINTLEINEYKGFSNFKLDNLSQINIISGKNNTGKTALLEAISILKSSDNLRTFKKNIALIFKSRDLYSEDLEKYFEDINLSMTIKDVNIKIEHHFKDELEIDIEQLDKRLQREFDGSEEFLIMYHNDKVKDIMRFERRSESAFYVSREKSDTAFIDSSKPNNSDLTTLYSSIQDLGIQDKFLTYLQIIDKNIIRIEPQLRERKSFLRVTLKNPHRSLFSSELGEGTNRFIEILCVLLSNVNGTVLIDEIENGIHYTKLYDVWKAIIEIVQKETIQLFVTTHDDESIEALLKASQDRAFEKVTSIKLFRDEENQIQPSIKNFEILEYGIEQGADVR
jgi:AAA15 family ATPase/GTPase